MTGATGNFYCGLHEYCDMAFLLHYLRPEDTFLDIGANVGSYTVLASGAVGARSIALEPAPSTFKKLQRNVQYNAIGSRTTLINAAVGENEGELLFSMDRDTMNQVVSNDYCGKRAMVPVRSIDSIQEAFQATFWKVDVEGFEEQVLRGAVECLANKVVNAVMIETENEYSRLALEKHGFRHYSYDPCLKTFADCTSRNSTISSNHLWIRNIEFVQQRCKTSRKYSVIGLQV